MKKNGFSVVVIGCSFATGNLGVNALAWSTLKLIRTKWPNASVTFLGVGENTNTINVFFNGKSEQYKTFPVIFRGSFLNEYNFFNFYFRVIFFRLFSFLKNFFHDETSMLNVLLECDLICDITGGDSFSDIYGLKRLVRGVLLKHLCQLTGNPYILLPQTYGPFTSSVSKLIARHIIRRASVAYSRDREGVEVVQELVGSGATIRLCPDVAFVLDPVKPNSVQFSQLETLRLAGKRVLGLNVSGLLYHGGYSRDNMFHLVSDYPTLISDILRMFCEMAEWHVLLVSHVFPENIFAVEDDLAAAMKTLESVSNESKEKVIILDRGYDQNEIKCLIGLCDFFIGSRMHATIAALSQGIPAIGLAYSPKFVGVFATAGLADYVIDLRTESNHQVVKEVRKLFDGRQVARETLKKTIPQLQRELLTMFDLPSDRLGFRS